MDAFGSNDIRYLYYYLVMDIIIIHFSNHVGYMKLYTMMVGHFQIMLLLVNLCLRIKFPRSVDPSTLYTLHYNNILYYVSTQSTAYVFIFIISLM